MWTWYGDASISCAECEVAFSTWRPGAIVGCHVGGFVPRTWVSVRASSVGWFAGAKADASPLVDAVLELVYTPRARMERIDPVIVEISGGTRTIDAVIVGVPQDAVALLPLVLGDDAVGAIVGVAPVAMLEPPAMLVLEPLKVAFDEMFVVVSATPYWSAHVEADAESLAGSTAKAILTARRTDSAHAEVTSVRDQASIGVAASPVRTAGLPVHAWPRGGLGREYALLSCPTVFTRWVQMSCTSRGSYASADVAVRTYERKSLPVRGIGRNDLIVAPTSGWVRNRSEATAEVTAEICGLFG
jgi:hypothetical protein